MKYRGGYTISPRLLARRLGIGELVYKVEIGSTGNVTFWCYDAQAEYEVREGEEAPMVRLEDPRF